MTICIFDDDDDVTPQHISNTEQIKNREPSKLTCTGERKIREKRGILCARQRKQNKKLIEINFKPSVCVCMCVSMCLSE